MSVLSSPEPREDHLRALLDQRTARAGLHARFPSLSEFSDSPSVYSRAHFSPRPLDRAELDASFDLVVPASARLPREPREPMSDRERLNFPNASSLDLDDDPASSCAGSYAYSDDDDASPPGDDDEPSPDLPRLCGPKMTIHSPAPWELGEDDAGDEHDPVPRRAPHKKADAAKRVWGLAKAEKRPSTESSRSQQKAKQSLESFNANGGALLALAQASMSSTSLALAPAPQPTLRDKLSLSRLRSRTPSNPAAPAAAPDPRCAPQPPQGASPMSRLVRAVSPVPLSPLEQTHSAGSSRASTPSTPHHEYTHPYANPDLVRRPAHDPPLPLPSPRLPPAPALPSVNKSDSSTTLTDTTASSSMFQSRSITTMTSLATADDFGLLARVHGKGISAPISETSSPTLRGRDNKLAGGNPIPGWSDSAAGASLKLISLAEAQAQARERSRSATANPAISSPYTTGPPRSLQATDDAQGADTTPRARSTSASAGAAKARPDAGAPRPPLPGAPAQDPGAAPRVVARKKSGFMRLFNARERERTPYEAPPPVPSLSTDTLSAASVASAASGPTVAAAARARKQSAPHRVPVPSLAESGSSSDAREDSASAAAAGGAHTRERQLSARRNTPGLSIVTSPSAVYAGRAHAGPHSALPEHFGAAHGHGHAVVVTPAAGGRGSPPQPPSSAPPGATDFVALSLRPVSTLFGPAFAPQLTSPGLARPALDADTGTPTTAATAISPLSADFPLRAYPAPGAPEDGGKPGGGGGGGGGGGEDDEAGGRAALQALQDQILVARRAWQRQIWELEGQVRDLKAEVDELRAAEGAGPYCAACGRGAAGDASASASLGVDELRRAGVRVGVVNRPRARTGVGSRFASGT